MNETSLGIHLSVKHLGLLVPGVQAPVTGCLLTTLLYSLRSVDRSFGSSWGTWEFWASQLLVSIVSFPKENLSCTLFNTNPKRSRKGGDYAHRNLKLSPLPPLDLRKWPWTVSPEKTMPFSLYSSVSLGSGLDETD